MRRDDSPHSHPCAHCQTPVDCHGELVRNHDGFPETICHVFHVCGTPFYCHACYLATKQEACADCGEVAAVVFEDADEASGYRGDLALCAACIAKRQAA